MTALRCLLLSALVAACSATTPSSPAPGPEAAAGAATEAGAAPTTGAAAPSGPAIVPAGPSGQIHIVAGSYGPNCGGAHGNVTAHIASACNGKPACDYKVDYHVIGDPAVGCSKTYVAEWHCGAGSTVQSQTAPGEAGYGAVLSLSCPAQ